MIEFASLSPSPRRSRVLVADDTESIRMLYQKLLATDGHEVIAVADGEAALAAVHEHHPDVVLLDVTMPQSRRPGGVPPAQIGSSDAPDAGRARHRSQRPAGPHQRHRSGR